MGLYLVPATSQNLATSIDREVPPEDIAEYVTAADFAVIRERAGIDGLRCWAMTVGKRSEFKQMRPGDDVLITEKDTGLFTRYAQVTYKVHNRALGDSLWDFVTDNPWEYIYFLRDIRRIELSKPATVVLFGYKPNFAVSGVTRVTSDRIEQFERRYGTVTEWLEISVNHDDLADDDAGGGPPGVRDSGPTTTMALGERRRLQDWFSKHVKRQYGMKCALCDIADKFFLVAGHISPWASDEANRLNLSNGICLCLLHDRAFERGYIVLDDDLRVVLTPQLDCRSALAKALAALEGVKLREPKANRPDPSLLKRHRETFFRG